MRDRKVALVCGLLVLALAASPACVNKKLFRENVEDTDSRVSSAESAIESNERRIDDLRGETDSKIAALDGKTDQAMASANNAMSRATEAAEAADRAARGRLIWEVTLSDERVKFSFAQASVPEEARAILDDLANKIKSHGKAVYVEIEGHTDNTGSEDYNFDLGANRADAVRDYLNREGGVPLHAMNTISYGEGQPVADNSSSNGRAQNRRVVVRVLE